MTRHPLAAPYTLRSVREMLGISRGVVEGLVDAGFVAPTRGPRNEYRFTFQDVVLLRTAQALQAAAIPARRIVRALRRLQADLPDELPLTGLRITAVGSDVAVRDGGTQRSAESGQLLIDFDVAPASGAVAFFEHADAAALAPRSPARPPLPEPAAATPDDGFVRGVALEAHDRSQAEAVYRRVLAEAPDHAAAALNLGALLCEDGRCGEASALYRAVLARCPDDAALHFNLAIAEEDGGDQDAALASYDRCLALRPDFADAHYNAARLHEQRGDARAALRHYSAYRRLEPGARPRR